MQNRDVRIVPLLFGRIHMETCPQCDYVLESLPAAHACPECGFEYDDGMRWFKLKSMPILKRDRSWPYVVGTMFTLIALMIIYPDHAKLCYVVLVLFCFVGNMILWFRSDKGPGILSLSANGVDVYDKWYKRTRLPWSSVASVGYKKWTGFVVLRDADGRKLMSLYYASIGKHAQSLMLVDEVNRRIGMRRL
ncbi:MAG TPA: hypothetical protein PKN33_10970 [Phycisphaerae bacterium]|nr:hypothetical protein [Phycisphaerae bacterium]